MNHNVNTHTLHEQFGDFSQYLLEVREYVMVACCEMTGKLPLYKFKLWPVFILLYVGKYSNQILDVSEKEPLPLAHRKKKLQALGSFYENEHNLSDCNT